MGQRIGRRRLVAVHREGGSSPSSYNQTDIPGMNGAVEIATDWNIIAESNDAEVVHEPSRRPD